MSKTSRNKQSITQTNEEWLEGFLTDTPINNPKLLQNLYQSAKSKFDTLHVFSQPDSLTRRGEMLILCRKVTVWQANNDVIDNWKETLTSLFKHGVTFCDTSVDHQYNLRIWFLIDGSYALLGGAK